MNVFNEEPIQRNVKEVDSWPIKLAMKYGAKTEQQANTIVLTISIVLIIITVVMYKNLFYSSEAKEVNLNDLPPEVRLEIEKSGVKF